ncbi:MAG: porin [Planctomycetia bacterium]|nr:porin [Planctomycetia bacterium]
MAPGELHRQPGPAPQRRELRRQPQHPGQAQPFTHFGVMTTLHAADRWNLFNGLVNGWDRWIDRNERWGYVGGVVFDSVDGRTNLTLTVNLGPNQFPSFFRAGYPFTPNGVTTPPFLAGRKNLLYGHDHAFLYTGTLIHEWTDRLTTVLENDYGRETNVPGAGPGGTPADGQWYGLAGWSLYAFTDRLTGVYRSEVFRDVQGVRTGFNDTYYEMTLGLIVKPRSWFWVRPEVRHDWAVGAAPYDGGTRSRQLTLGLDTIFLF